LRRNFLCGVAASLLIGVGTALAEVPGEIRGCDDVAGYAPFVFKTRDNGGTEGRVTGYTVALLSGILKETGRRLTVDLLPFQRCLELAGDGSYDLVMSGERDAVREQRFLFTQPYFRIQPIYVFSRHRPAPVIEQISDIATVAACGQPGYRYDEMGLAESAIHHNPRTPLAAAGMLTAGRCDVFLTEAEVIAADSVAAGAPIFPDTDFATAPVPGVKPMPVYALVSRSVAYAEDLTDLLSQGIDAAVESGAADRMMQPYLGRHP
jgi:polar amino acid transport system substrate-binding protein